MSNISDHFMKSLELMARALGSALNKLIGIKQYNMEDAYRFGCEYFKEETNIDFGQILVLTNDELISFFNGKSFTARHYELLATFLFELSETVELKEDELNILLKSKFLFAHTNSLDKAFSIERQNKIKIIEIKLTSNF